MLPLRVLLASLLLPLRASLRLLLAGGALFLGRQHIFPAAPPKTQILTLVGFLPAILMIFWLARTRFTNGYKKKPGPSTNIYPFQEQASGTADGQP